MNRKYQNHKFVTPDLGVIKAFLYKYYQSFSPYKERYADVINKVLHSSDERNVAFACPICLEHIWLQTSENRYQKAPFNIDHFPPQSVGGKNKMIVCERCNNEAGRLFEPELARMLHLRAYGQRKPSSRIQVSAILKNNAGYPVPRNYNINLRVVDDKTLLIDFGKPVYPFVKHWVESNFTHGSKSNMSITARLPGHKKISRALMKTAYLYCFEAWGYDFAFSDAAGLMRKIISGTIENPIPHGYIYLFENEFEHLPLGVCILDEPKPLRSYIVHVPLILTEPNYRCVVAVAIPYPVHAKIIDVSNSKENADLEAMIKPVFSLPLYPNENLFRKTWEQYISGSKN